MSPIQWPDGLGPSWGGKNNPEYQRDACDDCYGDRAFCKACDQRKSDCDCTFGDPVVDRWLLEAFDLDSLDAIDPDDARGSFEDEDFRFQVCTLCERDYE
jgi:hypothetical protein